MIGRVEVFLSEACDLTDSHALTAADLILDAYSDWCEAVGAQPLDPERIRDALVLREVPDPHRPGRVVYRGIALQPSPNGTSSSAEASTSSTPRLDAILADRLEADYKRGT